MSARHSFAAVVISLLIPTFITAAPIEVTPLELRGAVQPQVAVAPSGRVHVVFGKDNAVFHTTSPEGRAFSAPVKVGELEKLALRMRRGPRVTATDKLVLVTAISHTDGNLHSWTSADGGKTWKEGESINIAPKSAREGLQALAGDGRGLVAAVWLDLRGKGTELWGRFSHDGGATWAADASIYQSPDGHICECCVPSVVIGAKGEIAAMWRNWLGGSRDMWAAISTDGGKTFPKPQKLGTGSWPLNGCPMDGGGMTFDAAGALAAVWRREGTVYSTSAAAPETRLAAGAQQPVIARARGGLAIAYEKAGEIILVVGSQSPKSLGKGRTPALAANNAGQAFVAWETADGSSLLIAPIP
jgi:hypothetical protein